METNDEIKARIDRIGLRIIKFNALGAPATVMCNEARLLLELLAADERKEQREVKAFKRRLKEKRKKVRRKKART